MCTSGDLLPKDIVALVDRGGQPIEPSGAGVAWKRDGWCGEAEAFAAESSRGAAWLVERDWMPRRRSAADHQHDNGSPQGEDSSTPPQHLSDHGKRPAAEIEETNLRTQSGSYLTRVGKPA